MPVSAGAMQPVRECAVGVERVVAVGTGQAQGQGGTGRQDARVGEEAPVAQLAPTVPDACA